MKILGWDFPARQFREQELARLVDMEDGQDGARAGGGDPRERRERLPHGRVLVRVDPPVEISDDRLDDDEQCVRLGNQLFEFAGTRTLARR